VTLTVPERKARESTIIEFKNTIGRWLEREATRVWKPRPKWATPVAVHRERYDALTELLEWRKFHDAFQQAAYPPRTVHISVGPLQFGKTQAWIDESREIDLRAEAQRREQNLLGEIFGKDEQIRNQRQAIKEFRQERDKFREDANRAEADATRYSDRLGNLAAAVKAVYTAAFWTTNALPDWQRKSLWSKLRDAAGIQKGTATALKLGEDDRARGFTRREAEQAATIAQLQEDLRHEKNRAYKAETDARDARISREDIRVKSRQWYDRLTKENAALRQQICDQALRAPMPSFAIPMENLSANGFGVLIKTPLKERDEARAEVRALKLRIEEGVDVLRPEISAPARELGWKLDL
jgi:hypothetical protein